MFGIVQPWGWRSDSPRCACPRRAVVQLSREQITELVAITATLLEERKRIRSVLAELPDSFAEVRKLLNELARTVR